MLWPTSAAIVVATVTLTVLSPVTGMAATAVLAVLVAAMVRVPAAGFVAVAVLLLVVASATADLVDPVASVPLRLGGIGCLAAAGLFRGPVRSPVPPHNTFIGLMLEERGVLRSHQTVYDGDRAIGVTTSGAFSPTLNRGIALARVTVGVGDCVHVEVRGKRLSARVVKPPFIAR